MGTRQLSFHAFFAGVLALISGCACQRGTARPPPLHCPPGTRPFGQGPPRSLSKGCVRLDSAGDVTRHGPWHDYYPTGGLQSETTWFDGRLQGARRRFFPSGRPASVDYYEGGLLQGISVGWNEAGRLTWSAPYRDGRLHGTARRYGPDGRLREIGEFSWGRRHGRRVIYAASGRPEYEASYRDGELHGALREHYPDGRPRARGRYERGRRVGPWAEWDGAGKVKRCHYRRGVPDCRASLGKQNRH